MKIDQNCIVDGMPDKVYHADPCIQPSLSSTVANIILEKTEIEAFLASKRLNHEHEDSSSPSMQFGTIGHEVVLRGEHGVYEIVPFDSFRTAEAKRMKEDIERKGLIAFNETTAERIVGGVKKMKTALFEQIADHKEYHGIMQKGKPERSAFFNDGKIWSRARFDWLEESRPLIVDYKTTGLDFERWEKNELWSGKYLQNPHYRYVLNGLNGSNSEPSRFIYLVQQTHAPYLAKIFEIDDSCMEQVEMRYQQARVRFAHCIQTGIWRGEPPYAVHTYPPAWVLQKWEMEEADRFAIQTHEEAQKNVQSTFMAG